MHQRLALWWESTSLRSKITGASVLVITLALFGIGVGTVSTVQRYLLDEVDRKIVDVSLGLPSQLSLGDFSTFDSTGGSGARTSFFLAAISRDGETLASNLND